MTIIQVIFPIFAIALIGYITAYKNWLTPSDIDGVSRFVFTIAIPVLLFQSLIKIELPVRFNWQFLLSYYLVALIVYGLGIGASRQWFKQSLREQGAFGLGAAYSNTVLVGLPIISAGLGEAALLPLFMLISIHSGVLFLIFLLLMERGNGAGHSSRQIAAQTLKNLIRNPIVIGLALGLAFNLLNIPLPPLVDDTFNILGKATLPCALFVLGASLNSYRIAGHFAEAWTIVGLKLVLQPLLVWVLAFVVFHLDPLWGAVAVMTAGMPVGINSYILAQQYQVGMASLSTAILLSTLLAVITQSMLLAIFI